MRLAMNVLLELLGYFGLVKGDISIVLIAHTGNLICK